MRVTTVFKRLLRLDDVNVTAVEWHARMIVVTVALRRRRLVCPLCPFKTSSCYDRRDRPSRWRHLDLGVWQIEVRCTLRRLRCPHHGVVVEGVPFARPGAHLTRDLDDLLAWLATRMDKTAIARLCRVSWRTVSRACERVVASELDPKRLDGLFRIGVDEISWRKHHKYLTLVVDHDRGRVVWGAEGKDAGTLDKFFTELGTDRSAMIEAVSMDLGPAFLKSVRAEGHAPQALVCADVFHLVKLVGDALDDVNVTAVEWHARMIVVTVALRRRRLVCPLCPFKTSSCYDRRDRPSRWRHLDLGVWQIEVRCTLRRLRCPHHGVVVEGVPFARPGAHLTRDLMICSPGWRHGWTRPRSPGCPGCRGAPSVERVNGSSRPSWIREPHPLTLVPRLTATTQTGSERRMTTRPICRPQC